MKVNFPRAKIQWSAYAALMQMDRMQSPPRIVSERQRHMRSICMQAEQLSVGSSRP